MADTQDPEQQAVEIEQVRQAKQRTWRGRLGLIAIGVLVLLLIGAAITIAILARQAGHTKDEIKIQIQGAISEDREAVRAKLQELYAEIYGMVKDARSDLHNQLVSTKRITDEVGNLVIDLRRQVIPPTANAIRRVDSSLKAVTDELQAITGPIKERLPSVMASFDSSAASLAKTSEGFALLVTDPKLDSILSQAEGAMVNVNAATGKANLILDNGNRIALNVEGITGNLNLMSADAQKYLHLALFPPPQKGVVGFLKKYVLKPAIVAGKLTFFYLTRP